MGEMQDELERRALEIGLMRRVGQVDTVGMMQLLRELLEHGDIAEEPVGRLLEEHLLTEAKHCTDEKHMDFAEAAMLVCALSCDALFEWGYIFADSTGRVRRGRTAETNDLQGSIDLLIGKACTAHNAVTKENFEVHRALVEAHRND